MGLRAKGGLCAGSSELCLPGRSKSAVAICAVHKSTEAKRQHGEIGRDSLQSLRGASEQLEYVLLLPGQGAEGQSSGCIQLSALCSLLGQLWTTAVSQLS